MSTAETAAVVPPCSPSESSAARRGHARIMADAWSAIVRAQVLTDRLDATYGPGLIDGQAGHEAVDPTVEDYRYEN